MLALIATVVAAQAANTLTAQEKQLGFRLLFDGKSTKGWHNFKSKTVSAGWQVKDGVLSIADPSNAGDLVSDAKFTWFELSIDFKMEKEQNSGIMFRVQDSGKAPWHTGPEVQIYDHPVQEGLETTGFLYQLYPNQQNAVKPAGEWQNFKILVDPRKCSTHLNGKLMYDFVIDSEDFWARVKKSKFSKFPDFAKNPTGHLAIQGDHGKVSFRNIKIREIGRRG